MADTVGDAMIPFELFGTHKFAGVGIDDRIINSTQATTSSSWMFWRSSRKRDYWNPWHRTRSTPIFIARIESLGTSLVFGGLFSSADGGVRVRATRHARNRDRAGHTVQAGSDWAAQDK